MQEGIKISNLPWYQDWGLQLKEFIVSDKKSTEFWTIEPGKWRAGKFEIKKENVELIEINNQDVETIHTKISLAGWMMKMFWSGDIWFRKSDGIHIYSKTDPDDTKKYTQFVEER